MTKQIVELSHVSFAYRESAVLKDVSFSVQEGEFIGIIGPNGGGKTTLLKLIMGFLKPDVGSIHIFGKIPQQTQQLVAYVPQSMRFDRQFPISVLELVLLGRLSHLSWHGQHHHLDKEKAIEAMEKVGIAHLQNASFGELSGGQAQRALIARALVSEPKLLLLDEPTASVDSQAEMDIYNILDFLKKQMTIMMVTHDLNSVIERVDRVICVQNKVFTLLPQEVCEHFALGLYHTPLIKLGSKT